MISTLEHKPVQPTPAQDSKTRSEHSDCQTDLNLSSVQFNWSTLPIQPKLQINQPGDRYEQEADRIANQVVSMPETGRVQERGFESVQRKPLTDEISVLSSSNLQRKCSKCEKEEEGKMVQRKENSTAPSQSTASFQSELQTTKGGGQPMNGQAMNFMNSRFGMDFSYVRIHNDAKAARLSQNINAKAFTLGNDIYFNEGGYSPQTLNGQRLLAHELVHTVQQGNVTENHYVQKQEVEGASTNSTIETASIELLNRVLPVGSGFYFEINGGITWGYPIYTGGSAVVYISRTSESRVQFTVRKQGRLAFDTGIGGSVMLGRQRSRGSSRNNGIGVGGEAGANFMAGVLGTVIEEYSFPTSVFLGVMTAQLLNNALEVSPASLSVPVQSLLDTYAFQYMTHQRFEAGVFAQGDAEIGAGIRRPSDSFNESEDNRQFGRDIQGGSSTWGPNSERRDFQGSRPDITRGDPLALLNFLNQFLNVNVNAQIVGGIDQRRNGNTTTTSVFLEGQVGAMIGIPIPVVGSILASLPPDAGAGVELQINQTPGQRPIFNAIVYTKQGEDQYYAGAAGQQNMIINLTTLLTPDQIMNALQSGNIPNINPSRLIQAFEKVSFFSRLVLGGQMLRGFGALIRRQRGARSLLSDSALSRARRVYGFNLESYLDFSADMSGPDFMNVVNKLISVAQGAVRSVTNSQNMIDAYRRVSDYLSGYTDSQDFESLQNEILDNTAVTMAKIRLQIGAGVGASARLAEGAKVRGDLSAEAGISCELDIATLAGGRITLRTLIPLVERVIEDPIEHMPDCPILQIIFSRGGENSSELETNTGHSVSNDGNGPLNSPQSDNSRRERTSSTFDNFRRGSDSSYAITENYPDNVPDITFPILNVYGPISLNIREGTRRNLRFEIQVPHRNNQIILVPISVRVVENNDAQIVLEVTQTWWSERFRIGSQRGVRYTLEKVN